MAEFCKQCADEQGLPNDAEWVWNHWNHILTDEQRESGEWGLTFLCEGCGITTIGPKGECIATNCLRRHGEED